MLTLYVAQLISVNISLCKIEVYKMCISTQDFEPHKIQAVNLIAKVQ